MIREIRVSGVDSAHDRLAIQTSQPAKPADVSRVQDYAKHIIPLGPDAVDTEALRAMLVDMQQLEASLQQTRARVAKYTRATQRKHIKPAELALDRAESKYKNALGDAAMLRSLDARRTGLMTQLAILVGDHDAQWAITQAPYWCKCVCATMRVPVGHDVQVQLAVWTNTDEMGDLDSICVGPISCADHECFRDRDIVKALHPNNVPTFVRLYRTDSTRSKELCWGFEMRTFSLSVHDMAALKAIVDIAAGWVTALYDANITSGLYHYVVAEDAIEREIGSRRRAGAEHFHSRATRVLGAAE